MLYGILWSSVISIITNLRYKFSSRHFVIPVVIYSITFNLPKFWELTSICPPQEDLMSNFTNNTIELVNTTLSPSSCHVWQFVLVAREIRYPVFEIICKN